MPTFFLVLICSVPFIHAVPFKDLADDVLLGVYRYLTNEERYKACASINKRMCFIHQTETQETTQLMDEMHSLFQKTRCLGVRLTEDVKDRMVTIHDKLCLNERYNAKLPNWLNLWEQTVPWEDRMGIGSNQITSLIRPTSKLVRQHGHGQGVSNSLDILVRALASCSQKISERVERGALEFGTLNCLLYRHLWNHIATKTNAPLPPLESVYYLMENEGANSDKIRDFKLFMERTGIILIHHRFTKLNVETHSFFTLNFVRSILNHLARRYHIEGPDFPDSEWVIPLFVPLLLEAMKNESVDTNFHRFVHWTSFDSERKEYYKFLGALKWLLDKLYHQNDDESNRMLREILIGLRRHHAVFCINHCGFLSQIIHKHYPDDDRYTNFVGTMIQTLSEDMTLETAKTVARSIGEWRMQEIQWGEYGMEPDLTESMSILRTLVEDVDDLYDGSLPDQLVRLLAPEFDLLWNLVQDTDGYLHCAKATLDGEPHVLGRGKIRIRWQPRSRFKYALRE